MRITSSIEYATRLMVALGRQYGRATLSAEKLAASENVPSDYVNQLLLRLRRAGLVQSHRGTAGGYALSRPPAEVTLGQVVRAVEGKVFESVCEKYDGGKKDCHHQDGCGISPVWARLGDLIERYFDGITLTQLMADAPGSCGKVVAMLEKIPSEKI